MADNKKYWGGDSFFGNSDKRRADDAEAMWVGTALGAANAVAKLNRTHDEEMAEVTVTLDKSAANQITLMADRDAYKRLLEEIVVEIKNPEQERRFSTPDADLARGRLLQDTHRQSWTDAIKRNKAANNITPAAIDMARERSQKKMLEYKEDALAAQASKNPPRNGLK